MDEITRLVELAEAIQAKAEARLRELDAGLAALAEVERRSLAMVAAMRHSSLRG